MKLVEIAIRDIKKSALKLKQFINDFEQNFRNKTRNMKKQAMQYIQGQILENKRGNMTRLSKVVPDCNNQSLNHFISNSPWDEEGVINQVQTDITKMIGDRNKGSLHIDESGFPKQGNDSVGVKRQYCGRLGKVENCQVGVFLGYTNGKSRALIDKRLYLPEDLANDSYHRKKCKVPEEVTFKTKAELGLEMVLAARQREVPFGWVGMDCHYGEQPWFLDELNDRDIIYIADVPCNTRVWLEKPKTEIPPRIGKRGRQPTIERLVVGELSPTEVQRIPNQLNSSQWHRVFIRHTERKELWSQLACLRVYPVRHELPGEETWLIIRKDEGECKTKYQLSNASPETSIKRLAKMSASRYWIERALEDAKGELGLGDYEVRGWLGWHHHMTMVLLAMLFLLELQLELGRKAPMLTIQDVREILEVTLPKRNIRLKDLMKIIEEKHRARYSAKKSHYKRELSR